MFMTKYIAVTLHNRTDSDISSLSLNSNQVNRLQDPLISCIDQEIERIERKLTPLKTPLKCALSNLILSASGLGVLLSRDQGSKAIRLSTMGMLTLFIFSVIYSLKSYANYRKYTDISMGLMETRNIIHRYKATPSIDNLRDIERMFIQLSRHPRRSYHRFIKRNINTIFKEFIQLHELMKDHLRNNETDIDDDNKQRTLARIERKIAIYQYRINQSPSDTEVDSVAYSLENTDDPYCV